MDHDIISITLLAAINSNKSAATTAIAYLVLALPLFSGPFIFGMMGRVGERFGAWRNNRSKGLIDRSRNKGRELFDRNGYQQMRKARKAERDHIRRRKLANKVSGAFDPNDPNYNSLESRINRRRYSGLATMTHDGREAAREAQASAYDQTREELGKATERTRGRVTDTGAFTAGSRYFNEAGQEMDKDSWMDHVYMNKGRGSVEGLDGKRHEVDGHDEFVNRAIAAQAAKSGDKAMYGKLLRSAMAMKENGATEEERARGAELEFRLRDQGINNSNIVAPGHPDVVKGSYSASKAISADALLAMDGSAVERMGTYLSTGENVYADLRIGEESKLRAQWNEEGRTFTDKQVVEQASTNLGRTVDADGKVTYTDDGRINKYITTARDAFREAVYQLNTKDIYSGKAVAGGDLDVAVKKAAVSMGMNDAEVRFGNPNIQRPASATAQTGGTIITPQPSAGGTTTNAGTEPTEVQIQRQRGGNFGGFNQPTTPTTPTTPPTTQASSTGFYQDHRGRQTPNSVPPDQADDFHDRFGGGGG